MDGFLVSHQFFAFVEENVAVIESEYCYAAEATGDETFTPKFCLPLTITRWL
jgi:hypothetical protein